MASSDCVHNKITSTSSTKHNYGELSSDGDRKREREKKKKKDGYHVLSQETYLRKLKISKLMSLPVLQRKMDRRAKFEQKRLGLILSAWTFLQTQCSGNKGCVFITIQITGISLSLFSCEPLAR